MDYLRELKGTLSKGISIRDKDTLLAYFGDYWKGLKPSHTGYVAACLNTMGNYFAKATFRLYKKRRDAYIEIFDHPFLELLENPNNFQVENELKHYIGEFFGVYGNFYLLKDRGVVSGKVRGLQILDPKTVKPISTKTEWIDHYELQLGMKTINLKRDDVIHLKYLSANSHIEGVGLINAIKDILDIDAFQTQYISQFYENGGFLGQVFTTSQNLRPAEFERAKKELRTEYGGKENSHKLALFTGGLEPIKSAYSLKDMEMTTQRKLTLEEVMTAFRIPKILLGGEGGQYNKATAQAAEYSYASTMIEPALNYVDQVFTKHVRMDYGDKYVVKHDPVSPKDVEENLKYHKGLTEVGGKTINEIRVEENYDPFPYELADVPIINVGGALVRLDTGDQLGQVPNNVLQEPKSIQLPVVKENNLYDLHWKQFNRRVSQDLKWFERRVNDFFDEQKGRLLEKLNLKDALTDTFYDSQDELALLMNMIENAYMRFLERGFQFSGGQFNPNFITEGIKSQFLKYSESINKTSKDRLNNKMKEGGDLKQIINDVYENFKSGRSPLIAESTGVSAFNAGLWLGYRTQGYTHKTWISQRDDKVRHSHFLAEGQRVKIDEHFSVGNDLLMYPGDPAGQAEEVINCRCTLIGDKNG